MTEPLNTAIAGDKMSVIVKVVADLDQDHRGQAAKLKVRDKRDGTAVLQVFRSSPVADIHWQSDKWYRLNAVTVHGTGPPLRLAATGQTICTEVPDPISNQSPTPDDESTTLLHMSDTHLGRMPYGSETRERDFTTAFLEAVDLAVTRDVDAVVHTGDVTHHNDTERGLNPDSWDALERLHEASIPLYLIVGNHDQTADGQPQPWLTTTAERGLCHRLDRTPTVVGSIALYGIDYHPGTWWRDRDRVSFETPPDGVEPVLCLHQSAAPLAPDVGERLQLDTLLRGSDISFTAVLLGHSHYTQADMVAGVPAFYAGSTERTTRTYRDDPTVVSEYTVTDEIRWTAHSLDTRPFEAYTFVGFTKTTQLQEVIAGLNPAGEVVTIFLVNSPVQPAKMSQTFESCGAIDATCYSVDGFDNLPQGIYAGDPESLRLEGDISPALDFETTQ